MSLRDLELRTAYWQGRLNLREWRISVRWGSAKEFHGRIWWNTEELTATMEINKYTKNKEETLVHELLHLVLQGHEELTAEYDVNLEKAINRIAAALIIQ